MEIYDQLLRFPLFLGMSHADLMEVVGHTRLGFSKLPAGKWLVREGEPCTHLIFLTHGTLQCETQSADHSCRVVEHLSAPYTLQPEQLFGLSQRYTSSYKTKTVCNFISIERETQRQRQNNWRAAPKTLRERLVRYFFSRCLYPAGAKTFFVLMQQIADDLNDSRLDISRALNEMERDQLLTLHRGRIEIASMERLLM